jgi:ribosome biogenesis GTPase
VARVDRTAYDLIADDGPLRLPALPPPAEATVGDWLAVTDDAVHSLLPRTSLLVRGAGSGASRTQPLAANVDVVLVCASLSGPLPVRNALAGGEVMATGDVRRVDGKGRHTTTHRELVLLPSGAVVIDTPGLRRVALSASDGGLSRAFCDVEELAAACRFADCAHAGEPGCAVQASIDAGDLPVARMESWRKLQREIAFQAGRADARLRAEQRARWKANRQVEPGPPGPPLGSLGP